MELLFKHRFIVKYCTIIAGILLIFGMLYLNNKEIAKTYDSFQQKSKSTYHHQRIHPHFHSQDLERLMRHRHHSLPLYEPGLRGVNTGLNFGFSYDHPMIKSILKQDQKFVDLNQEYVPSPVLVMALSTRRYEEALDAIGSVHRFLPNEKLIVYDVGMTLRQKAYLSSLCNVEIVEFPFKLFPPYVRLLLRFHWKPLVMQMALNKYGAILWMESSTRFITGDLSAAIREAKQTGIRVYGVRHTYSTFSVTNPSVFMYLPSDMTRMRVSGQLQSAPMIIYHTRPVAERVMQWAVLCALERRCMSPTRASRRCYGLKRIRSPASGRYLHCHRYDQSVFNVLLKNMFNFDSKKILGSAKFSTLKRGREKRAPKPKICKRVNLAALLSDYRKEHPHARIKIRYHPIRLAPDPKKVVPAVQPQAAQPPPVQQKGVPPQPQAAQPPPAQQQGVPVQQQAVPAQQQGVPVQQQGVPLQQQGVPVQQQGVPVQQQGVPLQQQGVPLQQQGVSVQQQGVPVQQQGVPLQQQGVPVQQQGVPVQQHGVPVQQQGVPAQQQGVPLQQQGVPVQQQGVPVQQQGVPAQHQGMPVQQQGVPVQQNGVPVQGGAERRAIHESAQQTPPAGIPVNQQGPAQQVQPQIVKTPRHREP
ncbi:uncharacterized protein LOC141910584 [Tubulanus polymorphus]|uniref:uncharacterized protein LOC141910584 n=1 Tax=Tubulanus polymorphus TaxID=672921 RepID=UPI003DA3F2C5